MKLNDPVSFAKAFATALHADQGQAYGGRPYSYHLEQVVRTLITFGFIDKKMLTAGYLHDALEDCAMPSGVIRIIFGAEVAELVEAVSDPEGYPNRKTRKAAAYVQIKAAGEQAIALKLADRIANVEFGILTADLRMQTMYRQEYEGFQAALRTLGQLEPMWAYLQSLHLKTP